MPIVSPSNATGLYIAEETSLETLGAGPWYPMEPNSYSDFGAQTTLVPRDPINAARTRQKGVLTDLEVAGGFNADFTALGLDKILEGFMFTPWLDRASADATAAETTGDSFTIASGGAAFIAGNLLFVEGGSSALNHGFFVVDTGGTGTAVPVTGNLADETAAFTLKVVGHQFASGDLDITRTGAVCTLTLTTANWDTIMSVDPAVGDWLWVGGDAAGTFFDNAGADTKFNGFYRVSQVTSSKILTCDRFPLLVLDTNTTTPGTTTIQVFFPSRLYNRVDPAEQVFKTYHIERFLKTSSYEYLKGCAANTLAINMSSASKITADLSYVGTSSEYTTSVKAGSHLAAPVGNRAFNTSSSVANIRFSDDTTGASLATYLKDIKMSIDNGVTGVKAVSKLGSLDLNYGDFTVAGTLTAYFTTTAAVQAILDNDDCSLDMAITERAGTLKLPVGWLFDLPLLALSDGRLAVEKDTPITLPITMNAAGFGTFGYTLQIVKFHYLPVRSL
jgi:hypothetical protein